jgi:ribose transport system substrate-binding protein
MRARVDLAVIMVAAISSAAWGAPAKFAWYIPAPHPYFDTVKAGVDAFAAEFDIAVRQQVGPDWNMDSESTGMLALAAEGSTYLSVYPADPRAANGLYDELVRKGCKVANFGASTLEPTSASFAVRTDVKDAAMAAAEFVIGKMGGKGTLVNVLEAPENPNTRPRKDGILRVAAAYPGVKLVEVAGVRNEQDAVEKIERAIAGAGGYVDGVICTGDVPTVALSRVLTDYETKNRTHIHGVGMDTDPVTMKAIADGYLEGTVSQNPYGQGYLSLLALKYLSEGYTPRHGAYTINSGIVMVTTANMNSYHDDLTEITNRIKADFTTRYVTK